MASICPEPGWIFSYRGQSRPRCVSLRKIQTWNGKGTNRAILFSDGFRRFGDTLAFIFETMESFRAKSDYWFPNRNWNASLFEASGTNKRSLEKIPSQWSDFSSELLQNFWAIPSARCWSYSWHCDSDIDEVSNLELAHRQLNIRDQDLQLTIIAWMTT